MLSREAMTALAELDAGMWMNTTHTTALELIRTGMAFDSWGRLQISEAGRRAARMAVRRLEVIDDQVADIGAMMCDDCKTTGQKYAWSKDPEPCPACKGSGYVAGPDLFSTPEVSHALPARYTPVQALADRSPVGRDPDTDAAVLLTWSRTRAAKAAGVANGQTGVWVDQAWIAAFLEAYENERGDSQ